MPDIQSSAQSGQTAKEAYAAELRAKIQRLQALLVAVESGGETLLDTASAHLRRTRPQLDGIKGSSRLILRDADSAGDQEISSDDGRRKSAVRA